MGMKNEDEDPDGKVIVAVRVVYAIWEVFCDEGRFADLLRDTPCFRLACLRTFKEHIPYCMMYF